MTDAFTQAIDSFRKGQRAEAAERCEQILASDPKHLGALRLLSEIRYIGGRTDDALALAQRVAAIEPENAQNQAALAIILARLERWSDALPCFEALLATRPNDHVALNGRGVALSHLGRYDEAIAAFTSALAAKPDFVEAHSNFGNALRDMGRPQDALGHYDTALVFKPDYVQAHINRGVALSLLDRYEDAIVSYDKAISFQNKSIEALNNLGNALRALNRIDDAIRAYNRALSYRGDDPYTHWNKALSSLVKGDYAAGWADYEWRWQKADFAHNRRDFEPPMWNGADDLTGKTIVLFAEQGLGDTIQFCRYAPLVAARGATVLLEVQRPLASLMASLDGATVIARGDALPTFDLHYPLLSLPCAFHTDAETIPATVPYLHPSPGAILRWQKGLGAKTKPRIGLVWSGSAVHKNDRHRSVPIETLAPLLSDQRFDFHFAQLDVFDDDRDMFARFANVHLHDDAIESFDDTAALLQACDLTLTVDTAAAHLGGALGLPTWVMLPFSPDWRWLLDREDSPWYPTMRLFRQPSIGDWPTVIANIGRALAERFG